MTAVSRCWDVSRSPPAFDVEGKLSLLFVRCRRSCATNFARSSDWTRSVLATAEPSALKTKNSFSFFISCLKLYVCVLTAVIDCLTRSRYFTYPICSEFCSDRLQLCWFSIDDNNGRSSIDAVWTFSRDLKMYITSPMAFLCISILCLKSEVNKSELNYIGTTLKIHHSSFFSNVCSSL